jgi:hypothetical protein
MDENQASVSTKNPRSPLNTLRVVVAIMAIFGAVVFVMGVPGSGSSHTKTHALWASYAASVSVTLTVDPQLPYDGLIKAGGYASVDDRVSSNKFASRSDRHEARMVLLQLDCSATTDQILTDMKRSHLHPANIFDLLAFGALRVDVGENYKVVELASSLNGSDGDRHYVTVVAVNGQRRLSRDKPWSDMTWQGGTFFLAIQDPVYGGVKM